MVMPPPPFGALFVWMVTRRRMLAPVPCRNSPPPWVVELAFIVELLLIVVPSIVSAPVLDLFNPPP